jgi:eukaryotic-like serine/threonine-protein kinase
MNTSKENKCRHCGAPIPASSTDQLCPACLMSGALKAGNSGQETVQIMPGLSPSTPEPTEFPCELGDYRLLGLLGRGGMGAVYEAEQRATGRRVALKVLGQQLDSPDMRHRFLREGRLAAGIRHPNSLYVFGSEEIEGLPVITMEISGSGTLKDKLKKRGPLPVTEAVDAILDVIAGLEAAFAVGVLHRDIKPSNCFVSPDGSVKIGDFGLSVSTLAKDDSYITATGVIMGTPAYASPEQLRGDNLDVRADIYSVGATLFTLLTGRAPFEGENAAQVVANAVSQKPKLLTELRQDVPPGLERVVSRCLAKEPNRRYADYAALRNALLPFSSQVPEPASMKVRALPGWIDYLVAFLIPYLVIMLSVGGAQFHIQPLIDRTLYSARYYFIFLGLGLMYFSITEGIWRAGLGKRLMGLWVVRADGRAPRHRTSAAQNLDPDLLYRSRPHPLPDGNDFHIERKRNDQCPSAALHWRHQCVRLAAGSVDIGGAARERLCHRLGPP